MDIACAGHFYSTAICFDGIVSISELLISQDSYMSLALSCIDLDWELHRWCPFVKPFPARYAFNISALVGGHKSWQVWLHLKLDQHHDSDLGYVNSNVLCKIPFINPIFAALVA